MLVLSCSIFSNDISKIDFPELNWSQLWPHLQENGVMGGITLIRHMTNFNASEWLMSEISPTSWYNKPHSLLIFISHYSHDIHLIVIKCCFGNAMLLLIYVHPWWYMISTSVNTTLVRRLISLHSPWWLLNAHQDSLLFCDAYFSIVIKEPICLIKSLMINKCLLQEWWKLDLSDHFLFVSKGVIDDNVWYTDSDSIIISSVYDIHL